MRISMWLQPYPSYCLLSPLLAIWNRCGRKKGHTLTRLPITYLWLQYKKWYALKAMISAPGFSISSVRLHICVCVRACTRVCVYVCLWRVALTFICSIFPHGWERSVGKWKHHFLRHMIFFSSFLAVSGLVFTGCFICLIYVPCPDCCMGPACSSHMAVPHALMRCPISRNTNRVLRPSLWLYDVWTHKSFPETPDPGRSKPDQARGPSVYFLGGLFSVTWLALEPYIK